MIGEDYLIPKEMNLANQLCFSVYSANRLFNKFYQLALKEFDLTYPQYIVLLALWEQDNQTLNQLGKQLDLESNTLTPLLKRLETAGWVIRHRDVADKRQLIVSLTQEGAAKQDNVFAAVTKWIDNGELDVEKYHEALRINNDLINELTDSIK